MKRSLSIYIHIPFCKTICTYCAFLTFAHKNKWIPDYIDALKKEIELKSSAHQDKKVVSIYFGGGTPSLIAPIYIEEIINSLSKYYELSSKIEICLEANPESLSYEKIVFYKKIGVNRISLGVQSLNSKTLFKIARPHNEKQIFTALENLKAAKFKNFGLDLIMGLPYQSYSDFQQELKTLLKYKPNHLSAYFLSYDTKKIDLFIKDCPGEEEQIKMYNYFNKIISKKGYQHYEVSNYALPGFECLHNKRYWNRNEYLGLGLGAHSFINETVSENCRNFEEYLKDPLLLEENYQLDYDTQRMDTIMLSLRQSTGIDLALYKKKYGQTELIKLLKAAQPYIKTAKLKKTESLLKPTNEGFLIIDKITKDLI